jgi:hypothetical protein
MTLCDLFRMSMTVGVGLALGAMLGIGLASIAASLWKLAFAMVF